MKEFILIGCCFFMNFFVHAQENTTITGGVFDEKTGQPLFAASVYYSHNQGGTITNAEGEFIINKITDSDSLFFSYIGYITKKYSVNDLPPKIFLEQSAISLSEAVIIPRNSNKLVKQLWNKYDKIYKEEKKNQKKESTFYYRQITKTDTLYNEFIECFLTGEHTFELNQLKLQQGRYAVIKQDSIFSLVYTNFFQISKVRPFRSQNPSKKEIITFLQPNFETIYNIEIVDRIRLKENDDVLVFNFQPKKKSKVSISGKLYVRETDLSILRFEGVIPDFEVNIKEQKKSAYLTFLVNYKDQQDSYPIVETVNCTLTMDVFSKGNNHKVQVVSTLFQVDQNFKQVSKKLKNKDALTTVIDKTEYDSIFWENNPIVKRTKIEEEVIKSFEKKNVFGTFSPE
jgi:hypothetical protein